MTTNFNVKSADEHLTEAFLCSPQGRRCSRVFEEHSGRVDRLLVAVLNAAEKHCLRLDPSTEWTAGDLCGDGLWGESAGFHRLLGLRLSFLVKSRLLPLRCINRRGRGTRRYRLDFTAQQQ